MLTFAPPFFVFAMGHLPFFFFYKMLMPRDIDGAGND